MWLPLTCPLLGTWLATQACALTGNRTGNPLVRRLALDPLSHTSQGSIFNFITLFFSITIYPLIPLPPLPTPLPPCTHHTVVRVHNSFSLFFFFAQSLHPSSTLPPIFNFFYPHLRICLLTLEREGEKEKHRLVASCACPYQGLNWQPFACALTRNRTL